MSGRKKWGFAGGIPTELDVAALVKTFGVPTPGTVLRYEELETCVKVTRDTHRFRTVVSAWRKKLEREHTLLTRGVPNKGIEVLGPSESVDFCARGYKRGLRSVDKSGRRAVGVPQASLTPDETRVLDHIARSAGQIRIQAALAARSMRNLPDPAALKPAP